MTASFPNLAGLLQEQFALARQLLELLSREERAIAGRQVGLLEEIAREKLALGEQLETLTRNFLAEIRRLGHTPDAAGVEACLGQGPHYRQWQELLDLLRRCQERNQLHGGLIAATRSFNIRLLELLQGREPTPTYGAGGQYENGSDHGSGASIEV